MSTKPGVTYAPSASIVAPAVLCHVADRDDAVAVDRDVAAPGRSSGAVDDRSAA